MYRGRNLRSIKPGLRRRYQFLYNRNNVPEPTPEPVPEPEPEPEPEPTPEPDPEPSSES